MNVATIGTGFIVDWFLTAVQESAKQTKTKTETKTSQKASGKKVGISIWRME